MKDHNKGRAEQRIEGALKLPMRYSEVKHPPRHWPNQTWLFRAPALLFKMRLKIQNIICISNSHNLSRILTPCGNSLITFFSLFYQAY